MYCTWPLSGAHWTRIFLGAATFRFLGLNNEQYLTRCESTKHGWPYVWLTKKNKTLSNLKRSGIPTLRTATAQVSAGATSWPTTCGFARGVSWMERYSKPQERNEWRLQKVADTIVNMQYYYKNQYDNFITITQCVGIERLNQQNPTNIWGDNLM